MRPWYTLVIPDDRSSTSAQRPPPVDKFGSMAAVAGMMVAVLLGYSHALGNDVEVANNLNVASNIVAAPPDVEMRQKCTQARRDS